MIVASSICFVEANADPKRARSCSLDGVVAADASLDELVEQVFGARHELERPCQRPGSEAVQSCRGFQLVLVEIVFELRSDVSDDDRSRLSSTFPCDAAGQRDAGCLCGTQSV